MYRRPQELIASRPYRRLRVVRATTLLLAICAIARTGPCVHAVQPATISFSSTVKPILVRRCFACHGPTADNGGLRLHTREAAFAELESGARAIVPGQPDASELLARVAAHDESVRMPPEGKPLSTAEIDAIRTWIKEGAKWEEHWAFIPPAPHRPPVVKNPDWVTNPIDAFVLAKLEANDLSPALVSDKRTLARRAYYNVTGLPPTGDQLDKFERDESSDAWNRLVDELLASSHYGEHWARHWLDLVRYAETNSYERDGAKPNAWKYRDYVIRSFNDDKPYDQFVREQLAGDELAAITNDSIIATGYYRLGVWDDEPADPEQARYDEWDDIVSTTSQVMLGLTVGCARCHDHKIDPIPQADYYGLLAFFADVTSYGLRGDQETNSQWDLSAPAEAALRKALREKESEIERQKVSMEEVGIKRMSAVDQRLSQLPERQQLLDEKLQSYLNPSEWELYRQTVERFRAARKEIRALPAQQAALALARCESRPAATHIMIRGNPHAEGDIVAPHFPGLFGEKPPAIPEAAADARSSGRRRVLAEWITSPRNMLTARVIVNRVWQFHFGRGIVRSSNNFGEMGTPPTHPELLDWLAVWLVEHNWQLKPLHRLIMTSSTYRMSSAGNEKALAVDPTNDLFWRFDMRRLSAEELRDSILVATGELNPKMHGPSFYPRLSSEDLATQSRPGDGWGQSTPEEMRRRSVYMFIKRSLIPPIQTAFDFPDVDSSCEARFVTVQPGQALALLNSEFANLAAEKLAGRAMADGSDPGQQAARALQLALGRPATHDELAESVELISRLQKERGLSSRDALRQWCLVVLNLSEFIYID